MCLSIEYRAVQNEVCLSVEYRAVQDEVCLSVEYRAVQNEKGGVYHVVTEKLFFRKFLMSRRQGALYL